MRGLPSRVVCDRDSAFSSRTVRGRARARGVALDFIEPGTPVGDACVASFHGRLRDECRYVR